MCSFFINSCINKTGSDSTDKRGLTPFVDCYLPCLKIPLSFILHTWQKIIGVRPLLFTNVISNMLYGVYRCDINIIRDNLVETFMIFSKYSAIKYILALLLAFTCQSLLAAEPVDNKNTYLETARTQLSIAFDNYEKGDVSASKKNLEHASDWLYKAVVHSRSDTVKSEAKQLATEIDEFRSKLNAASEKTDMAKFWHRASSLIIRESEQLIHGYIEQSAQNRVLKHLLDAKMHFYTAEHDLFISHDSDNATLELRDSLEYLSQAASVATPELKPRINNLISSLDKLIVSSGKNKEAWKENALVNALQSAVTSLNKAESVASPPTRMRIDSIIETILNLKQDTQSTSLKLKYDLIMSDFGQVINNI